MMKAAALAMQHLNVGDVSLVKEIAGLNETCNLRFTTEFIGMQASKNTAVDRVRKKLNNEDSNDSPFQPCAFQGAWGSGVSEHTSILTGLNNYTQGMYSFYYRYMERNQFFFVSCDNAVLLFVSRSSFFISQ